MASVESTNRELPPVTFAWFVVSLAEAAMRNLGEGADAELNLPVAKHTIDVLGVLYDKTRGNLDEEEHKLLEAVLYEARMKYLDASRS